jgi:hypothetical protein
MIQDAFGKPEDTLRARVIDVLSDVPTVDEEERAVVTCRVIAEAKSPRVESEVLVTAPDTISTRGSLP